LRLGSLGVTLAGSRYVPLEAGDTLPVDSTHVVRTGSDVFFERFDIRPCLAGRVLVDIHDMPLTFCRDNGLSMKPFMHELYAGKDVFEPK
jgi:hypothetical protein